MRRWRQVLAAVALTMTMVRASPAAPDPGAELPVEVSGLDLNTRPILSPAELQKAVTTFKAHLRAVMEPREAAWCDRLSAVFGGDPGAAAPMLFAISPAGAAYLAADAVLAHPDSLSAIEKLGVLLRNLDELDGAWDMFRFVHKRAPKRVPALVGLGYTAMELGDARGAEAVFRAAIAVSDVFPEPWVGLGLIELARGHRQAGQDDMRKGLARGYSAVGAAHARATMDGGPPDPQPPSGGSAPPADVAPPPAIPSDGFDRPGQGGGGGGGGGHTGGGGGGDGGAQAWEEDSELPVVPASAEGVVGMGGFYAKLVKTYGERAKATAADLARARTDATAEQPRRKPTARKGGVVLSRGYGRELFLLDEARRRYEAVVRIEERGLEDDFLAIEKRTVLAQADAKTCAQLVEVGTHAHESYAQAWAKHAVKLRKAAVDYLVESDPVLLRIPNGPINRWQNLERRALLGEHAHQAIAARLVQWSLSVGQALAPKLDCARIERPAEPAIRAQAAQKPARCKSGGPGILFGIKTAKGSVTTKIDCDRLAIELTGELAGTPRGPAAFGAGVRSSGASRTETTILVGGYGQSQSAVGFPDVPGLSTASGVGVTMAGGELIDAIARGNVIGSGGKGKGVPGLLQEKTEEQITLMPGPSSGRPVGASPTRLYVGPTVDAIPSPD